MDAVLVRLLESVARPVALALVHSLWQGVVVAALIAGALMALRGRSATLRYGVACIGMLLMLVVTVSTTIWFVRHPEPARSQEVVMRKAADDVAAVVLRSEPVNDIAPLESMGEGGATSRTGAGLLPAIDMELAGPWVFFGWVLGVLLLAAAHLAGWRRARALSRVDVSALPREWRGRLERLARFEGLARSVRAVVSGRMTVPTVVGCLRPVILIPAASFTELTASDLELILIHELAHIRRHDVLVGYVQAVAETLLFYHPAVWWISRRIRIEREHCCDDCAVRATGDGVAYARALSEVEHMRQRTPVHAMAADGGAFGNRIRRLIGAAPVGPSPRRAGLAGVLVVTLLIGLAVPSITAAPLGDASAQVPELVSSSYSDVEGEWRAKGFGGSIQIHFELPDWGEITMTMDADELVESGDGYRLEEDAGTFILEGGRMPRKWRRAIFRPDPAYASAMKEMGYEIGSGEHLLELAIHEIDLEFAQGIADAGFDVPLDTLVAFSIHDVTPDYVRDMAAAGYDDLTPEKIVEFAIHDIEPDYVRRLAAVGYDGMTPDRMIEFAIHDIDAEYVERLAGASLEGMPPSRIIEFAIHDIGPEYIERMAALGYEQLTPDRVIEFAIHDISPEYVEQLVSYGSDELTPSRIIEFGIHDVGVEFLRGLAGVGYGLGDVSPSRIIEFAIHDIDADFIKALEKKGITDLSPSELIERRLTGGHRHGSSSHRGITVL